MTEAPKPVFVLIGLLALLAIVAESYVGVIAAMEAGEQHATTAHAPPPPTATPPS